MPAGLPELRASVAAMQAEQAQLVGNLAGLQVRIEALAAQSSGNPELVALTNDIAVTVASITSALNDWSSQTLSQSYVAPAVTPLP